MRELSMSDLSGIRTRENLKDLSELVLGVERVETYPNTFTTCGNGW
jgi:hypothetical protein